MSDHGTDTANVEVVSPATGEHVGSVPVVDAAGVEDAVRAAREAQREWAGLSFSQRRQVLRRYRDALLDRKEEVAETISSESGKPVSESLGIELLYVCDAIGYWGKHAGRFLADSRAHPHLLRNKTALTTYKPRGVIGVISPWNFPFLLSIGESIPALMAGNAVVIKPSSTTPLSAVLGVEIAAESGLPPELFKTVTGPGETGWKLIDHVDMISFTGSVETGRKIQVRAAELLKPTTMELGGKDPMIVCRDADLERAANGCVWGALSNSGQVCISVERVYVDRRIHDDFVERVIEKVDALKQDAPNTNADLGPMTSDAQADLVREHIDDAVAKGATSHRSPSAPDAAQNGRRWISPTVLTKVDNTMRVMTEETFGPVIAIQAVENETEALSLANDSNFGLSASVWSKDKAGAVNIARRIEAGGVCVNDHMIHMMLPEVSMGGVKESGIGRRHGTEGIRKYCVEQSIVVDRFGLKREPIWYPSIKNKRQWTSKLLDLLYHSNWRKKLGIGRSRS